MGHMTIACDACLLRHSTACADCVVTFVLRADAELMDVPHGELDLDDDQQRVVALLSKAGLVPLLRHRAAS